MHLSERARKLVVKKLCAKQAIFLSQLAFSKGFLFRPHLWGGGGGGGEELYTQMGFFVQTILADRYIHRREVSGIIKKLVQRRVRN